MQSSAMSAQEQVADFVAKVVKDMGLNLEAQVETTADGTRINLAGDGAEALLARRGEGLQALQHIVDSAFRKQLGDQRLLVDCMDFRRGQRQRAAPDGEVSRREGEDLRHRAEHRPAERVRAPPRSPRRCRSSRRHLRKHRRRGGEDRHDYRRETLATSSQLSAISSFQRRADSRQLIAMFSTDDTIVAIATPAGRGGIGVVRISGPSAARGRGRAAAARRAPAAAACDVRAHPGRSGRRDLLPRPAFLHRRARRRNQRARQPGCAAADRRAGDGIGSAAGRAGRVHASRISQRPDRSRAGRGRRRSDRRRHAAAGARGVRSAGRDADRAHCARSTPSLFDLIAKLEASLDFPDEGYHFVEAGEAGMALRAIERTIDALLCEATARPADSRRRARGDRAASRTSASRACSTRFSRTGRAIVTPIPGTTRDLVTETADIDGLRLELVDTAGVRETTTKWRARASARARRAWTTADLVLRRARSLRPRSKTTIADLLHETADVPRLVVREQMRSAGRMART